MADPDKALEHAWKYFQLHAQQRITVFNYYVVFSGLLVTGLATVTDSFPQDMWIGIGLGLFLSGLSFVFFKLDQRVSFLIKNSEEAIKRLEPSEASLFHEEAKMTDDAKEKGLWTYGRAFRTMFLAMGLLGALPLLSYIYLAVTDDPEVNETVGATAVVE